MTNLEIASQIRSLKPDLEAVLHSHGKAKMRFFVCRSDFQDDSGAPWFPKGFAPPAIPPGTDEELWNRTYDDVTCAVDALLTSYLAPALHLDNYLEWQAIDIEWDDVKHDLPEDAPRPSNILRRATAGAYAMSILIAIKSALDRFVRIFSFYYKGFAGHTTWGRYDKKGKASGFMVVVERERHTDSFFAHVYDAYHRWIQSVVAPRDQIIHYRDPESVWNYISETGGLIQTHSIQDADGEVIKFGPYSLHDYVTQWYALADQILLVLSTRVPK